MSDSSVVRRFEICAVRPLWLATVAAAAVAAFTRHWWSLGAGVVAILLFGLIGASLHPMQSRSDLAEGPLEGPMAKLEQRSTPEEVQRLLVGRACTYLAMLLAAVLVWPAFAFLRWRWFVAIPSAYVIAALTGGILKYTFVLI